MKLWRAHSATLYIIITGTEDWYRNSCQKSVRLFILMDSLRRSIITHRDREAKSGRIRKKHLVYYRVSTGPLWPSISLEPSHGLLTPSLCITSDKPWRNHLPPDVPSNRYGVKMDPRFYDYYSNASLRRRGASRLVLAGDPIMTLVASDVHSKSRHLLIVKSSLRINKSYRYQFKYIYPRIQSGERQMVYPHFR